jgi:hypothetical protein
MWNPAAVKGSETQKGKEAMRQQQTRLVSWVPTKVVQCANLRTRVTRVSGLREWIIEVLRLPTQVRT